MTRTASSVGTEAEGRSAQNPVDRQVGEAVAWRWHTKERLTFTSWHPDQIDADPLIPASDLEQVTRERDAAVAALEKIAASPTAGLGCNPESMVKDARKALASLRSMEKTGDA